MPREGEVPKEAKMTIRVFYPNPIISHDEPWRGIDFISRLFNVSYLERYDPIYHELVFIDDKQVRHHVIGLAYHLEETMPDSGGIDGQA
jgi:hypothetical protein